MPIPALPPEGSTAWYEHYSAMDVEVRGKVDKTVTLNAQTGTAYTLVLEDALKLVTLNNAAAITLTVPPNSSAAIPVGQSVSLAQLGAGQVTITPGSGVTVNSRGGALKTAGQYAAAELLKIGTDTWLAIGDLSA